MPRTYSNHYSEDLTLPEPEPAEPAGPVQPGLKTGEKLDEPVDESLYKDLMAGSPAFVDLDNIDYLYDEVM